MSEWNELKKLLQLGLDKHGEKPLTNKWLLNILKMVEKNLEAEDRRRDLEGSQDDIY